MISPHTPSERRRRPADSRSAILAAAEASLLADGIEGLSIRRVAERCGYTAPTIYHHFGDKTGLVDAVLERRFRQVLELMRSIERGPDTARYLREMGLAFVRFALANRDHYRLLSVPRSEDESVPSAEAARELVKGALEDLAREGTLATANIEEAFQTTWAMLHGVISLSLLRPRSEVPESLLQLAFEVVERGLLRGGPRARRRSRS